MTAGSVAGLILAGGKSRRFAARPKEEATLNGRTLLEHVIDRARPQTGILAISRASDAAPVIGELPLIADIFADCGPLGGLHAGLVWASSMAPPASLLATFACDTPLIPQDLVSRLYEEIIRSGARGAIAASGGDLHPTLGLWSVSLEPLARKRLEAGECSLRGFAKAAGAAVVAFEDPAGTGFFNVNTLDDLAALAARLAGAKG